MAGHLEAHLRSVGSASWPLASGRTLNFDPFVRHLGEDPTALSWREVTCGPGQCPGARQPECLNYYSCTGCVVEGSSPGKPSVAHTNIETVASVTTGLREGKVQGPPTSLTTQSRQLGERWVSSLEEKKEIKKQIPSVFPLVSLFFIQSYWK